MASPGETLATVRRPVRLHRDGGNWDGEETPMLVGLLEDLDEFITAGNIPNDWKVN